MATGVDVPKHILDFVRLRCGVWKKQSKDNGSTTKKKPVMIEVLAEHLLPQQPQKEASESPRSIPDEPASPLPANAK